VATPTSELTDRLAFHRSALNIVTAVTDADGELLQSLLSVTAGHTKIAFFVDQNLMATAYVKEAVDTTLADVAGVVFTDIHENPCEADVLAAAAFLKPLDADCVVAIGGGSTIDTAKMALLLAFGGGVPKDWWPVHRHDAVDAPPLFVYPSTAGTGSEVQSHALISDDTTHRKMAIGHERLAPTQAVLDVSLLASCPKRVMILAGIDALSHALESAVTRTATTASIAAATDAFAMLWPALLELASDAAQLSPTAFKQLHAGATLAGMAIEASMLGSAHGCGNPLTARYGVVHGQAVSIMLPGVVALNERDTRSAATYRAIEEQCGIEHTMLVEAVKGLNQSLGLAVSLAELGITDAPIDTLASLAMEQWTCGHNPIPMTLDLCRALYKSVV
jgi:alcohol dehydrogenase